MWPWGHLAIGYLAYSLYGRLKYHDHPDSVAVIALAIGTQFPDLVDKPLAYLWAILPEGRSFAHSLLVIIPVCVLAILIASRYDQKRLGSAFAIGYLTHPIGDGYTSIIQLNGPELTYLLYPLLPPPDYEAQSFADHAHKLVASITNLNFTRFLTPWNDPFILELWIAMAVVILWGSDGFPPLKRIARFLNRVRTTPSTVPEE